MPILNKKIFGSERGVTVIAALIGILILGALGASMAYLVASNQQTRVAQVTGDQATYSVAAGIEFALGQVITDGSQSTSFSRRFSGETINISRAASRIVVSGVEGDAVESRSIVDPVPPDASNCLIVDISGVSVSGTSMTGVTLSRDAGCSLPVIIDSMNGTSWVPNDGETISSVRIDGTLRFSGAAPSGGNVPLTPLVNINDALSHPVNSIIWNQTITYHNFVLVFNFKYGGTNYSKSVNVELMATDQANCFSWNTQNARLTYSSNLWGRLTGTTISNSCAKPIRLDKMTVSWSPVSPSRDLTSVVINGGSEFNGSASSGTLIEVDNITAAGGTQTLDLLQFSGEMMGRNYSIVWTFADGTSKTTALDLFASGQNNCLDIDTSGLSVSTTDMSGITLQNTCGADIGIVSQTVSWVGDATRRLTQTVIDDFDGSNTYSSNVASGTLVSLASNFLYYPDASGIFALTHLRFNSNVVGGVEYTLTYTMSDATTKSVSFTPASQSNCLNVTQVGTALTGAGRDLGPIQMDNTCAYPITWISTTVSWTPTNPNRRLKRITYNGSNIWTGNANSGVSINHADQTLAASSNNVLNTLRFNNSMTGRTFTITFFLADGSSKTITSGPF